MPGTNLIFAINGLKSEDFSRCTAVQGQMLHYPFYTTKQIFQDRHLALGRTGYEGYPYLEGEGAQGFIIALEGRIYGWTREEVVAALTSFCAPTPDDAALGGALRKFSMGSDGEYVG